jgi:hypothetical protein
MKRTSFICFVFLFCVCSHAQVYEFSPKLTYKGNDFREFKSLVIEKVDSCTASFKFDLDSKMITFDLGDGNVTNLPIKKVKQEGNVIDISLKPYPGVESSTGYKLVMENNRVLYCQHYILYVGDSKNIELITYLNDPKYITFYQESFAFVKDNQMNGDVAKIQTVASADNPNFIFTENFFDMRDGKLTWTEGKGKNAVIHIYEINKVVLKESGIMTFTYNVGGDASKMISFSYIRSTEYPYHRYIACSLWDYNAADPDNSKILEYSFFR